MPCATACSYLLNRMRLPTIYMLYLYVEFVCKYEAPYQL